MDPDKYIGAGFLAAALFGARLLRPTRQRTDADRLRDIDKAEQAAIERARNPHVIAAAAKRERRRLRNLQVS